MAYVVEDGTGVPGANSYVSVEDADSYFSLHSGAWTGTEEQKEVWLVDATAYIELAFRPGFGCHEKLNDEQGLTFPTLEGGEGLPSALMAACCEYAVRAIAGPLLPDPMVDDSGFSVVTTKKKVGPIEKEFSVAGGALRPAQFRSYPMADFLMQGLLCPGWGGNRVIR